MFTYTENNIFNAAIEAFKKNIDFPVNIEIKEKILNQNVVRFDGLLKVRIENMDLFFCTEVKTLINKATIGFLLQQKDHLPHHQLLITKYISTDMAEVLRKNEIQFIDTAGNAYINNYPLYIFIKGNKMPDIFIKTLPKRAFGLSGLKMIFALLLNDELIKKPFRTIAEEADVALGTVGWVMRDLRELGFLIDMGKQGEKLIQKEKLFNRWCIEYEEKLRPKLLIGRFTGPNNWWINYTLDPSYAQWGGEVAANKITKYLKPQVITLYVERNNYSNIIFKNKLRKDEKGDIEFLKRFWKLNKTNEFNGLVHPILIYADLLGTGIQRNIETAKVIYEKFIDRYIR